MKVAVGKPYWVNLHFDGNAGTVSAAAFDPTNGFAQVGTTMVARSAVGAKVYGSIRLAEPLPTEIIPTLNRRATLTISSSIMPRQRFRLCRRRRDPTVSSLG